MAESRYLETQTAHLTAQLAEARLSALRMQLNPHFLFNSLNAITVLVRDQDTASASRMLEGLGDLLRAVLRTESAPETRLSAALEFLRSYLVIEQLRFSDRLRMSFDVDLAPLGAAVPQFLLQPIVENSIRHGISRRSEQGLIVIGVRREGDTLVLTVRNDGPHLEKA